jgi:hypothetical protein
VATERLEIEVEIAACVLEKVVAVPVERRSQDVEIPLVVKNPTVQIALVRLEVVVEFVTPMSVLRFTTLLPDVVERVKMAVLRPPEKGEKLVDV